VSSIAGTGAALWRYARAVRIPWRLVLPATAAALVGAWLGAAVVAWIPREAMRPLVVVMMLAVAIYTFLRKNLGHVEKRTSRAPAISGAARCSVWSSAFTTASSGRAPAVS
jgi:uncharacterized membrane protein YfcA